jgi:uncharacterized membrane protein
MESWLADVTHYVALVIEAMALVIIAVGSVEAFVASGRAMLSARATDEDKRAIWLRYARWLVAGLTFQLAADVVHTSIAPTWDEVGRLGAIAVIRTFLSYFLERDVEEVRARQRAHVSVPAEPRT